MNIFLQSVFCLEVFCVWHDHIIRWLAT